MLETPLLNVSQHLLDLVLDAHELGLLPRVDRLSPAALQVFQQQTKMLLHPVPIPDWQVLLNHIQDDGPIVRHIRSHCQEDENLDSVPVLAHLVQGLLPFLADIVEVQAGWEKEQKIRTKDKSWMDQTTDPTSSSFCVSQRPAMCLQEAQAFPNGGSI